MECPLKNKIVILIITALSFFYPSATKAMEDDNKPIILRNGSTQRIFKNAAVALHGKVRNSAIVQLALAQGVIPEIMGNCARFKYKSGNYLCIASHYNTGEKKTPITALLDQHLLEYFKYYLEILNKAQTNPTRDILNIAIEKDWVYIVELLYTTGVPLFWKDLELAKIKNSKLVGKFLVDLPYFQTMHKIRQISTNGIGLMEEITDTIARMSN